MLLPIFTCLLANTKCGWLFAASNGVVLMRGNAYSCLSKIVILFLDFHTSADGMMFGALKKCPMCSGHLYYYGGTYRCHGYLSEWSKCSFSTPQPERIRGKWKIPEETDNQYLLKVFLTFFF